MNPLNQIIEDQQNARDLKDANADICFLALNDASGPSVRTLVLREVSPSGLTLFINKTSPKWRAIEHSPRAQILLWYPSLQKQYRLSGSFLELERSTIIENWQRRPSASKYLDQVYEKFGNQSSTIDSRERLTSHIDSLKSEYNPEDLETPANATGILLEPDQIECLDLNDNNRIHHRHLYKLNNEIDPKWHESVLIP